MPLDYKRLSRKVAHALRHAPEKYRLKLDEEGWTPVESLLAALRQRHPDWKNLSEDDLVAMMAQSSKQRYELRAGRIRALYGHSTPEKIKKIPAVPPDVLYHGTAPEVARVILAEGLKSMQRQYVHLSTNEQTAHLVGGRKSGTPTILKIRAAEAHRAGIAFYHGNEDIWLADYIPPQYIEAV
jgi:putative RNA 2'-phosphotransferase